MPGFYKLNSDKKFHINSWFYKVPADGKWHPVRNAFYKVPSDNKWHPVWLYDWEIGPWSQCTALCDGGTQSRIVQCKRSDTLIVHDSFCDTSKKPTSQQSCNTSPCVWNLFKFNVDDEIDYVQIYSGEGAGINLGGRQGVYNALNTYVVSGYTKPPTGTKMQVYLQIGNSGGEHLSLAVSNMDNTPVRIITMSPDKSSWDKNWWHSWAGQEFYIAGWGKQGRSSKRYAVLEITII